MDLSLLPTVHVQSIISSPEANTQTKPNISVSLLMSLLHSYYVNYYIPIISTFEKLIFLILSIVACIFVNYENRRKSSHCENNVKMHVCIYTYTFNLHIFTCKPYLGNKISVPHFIPYRRFSLLSKINCIIGIRFIISQVWAPCTHSLCQIRWVYTKNPMILLKLIKTCIYTDKLSCWICLKYKTEFRTTTDQTQPLSVLTTKPPEIIMHIPIAPPGLQKSGMFLFFFVNLKIYSLLWILFEQNEIMVNFHYMTLLSL